MLQVEGSWSLPHQMRIFAFRSETFQKEEWKSLKPEYSVASGVVAALCSFSMIV